MRTLKVFLAVGITALTTFADVEINAKNFPDKKFRDWISVQFDYPEYDGIITTAEIAKITEISPYNTWDISSLTGIEHFTALTYLEYEDGIFTSIDLSANTELTYLRLGYCKLTSLDVSNNTKLTFLNCEYNNITSLNLSANTELTELKCSNNKLTSLDLSSNTKLTKLNCSYNYIPFYELPENKTGWTTTPQLKPTSIVKTQKSDSRFGIRFAQNIVSDKAEISVVLPNNDKAVITEIVVYDMTGNVVFNTTGNGNDNIVWDLTNDTGRTVANGTYLVVSEVKSASGMSYHYSAKLGVKR